MTKVKNAHYIVKAFACLLLVLGACESSDPASSEDKEPAVPEIRTETHTFRFNDDSEIANWFKQDVGSWWIDRGRLVLEINQNAQVVMNVSSQDNYLDDVDVSVETEWLEGGGLGSYGIMVRMNRTGGYGFAIVPNQGYAVTRWGGVGGLGGGTPAVPLIDLTESTVVINRGRNSLQVKTEGAKLSFFVNTTLLAEVSDSTFRSGRVGLFVGAGEQVAFDDLVIVNTFER